MLSIFLGCDRLCLLQPVHPDTGRGSRLQTLHLWGPGPRRHCSRHYSDCHVTCAGRWILNMMWIWICNLSAHYSLRNIRLQETQNIFAPLASWSRGAKSIYWDEMPSSQQTVDGAQTEWCTFANTQTGRRGGEEERREAPHRDWCLFVPGSR